MSRSCRLTRGVPARQTGERDGMHALIGQIRADALAEFSGLAQQPLRHLEWKRRLGSNWGLCSSVCVGLAMRQESTPSPSSIYFLASRQQPDPGDLGAAGSASLKR